MNDEQKLWWEQAKSDHAVFVLLRRAGMHECHMLHDLQMAAENSIWISCCDFDTLAKPS